ncbi:MAG: hypothetical protein A2X13_08235 [Bacteroidetes bacterium GWC2_33_15]|nr:MAG: hypothetical protein A2X10_10065 [Bacteroidetes bacterium GWA2_33_15]OFX51443.1 MAG: hypothetical protein A2X13_08235 [Bacteroidetes bacterium GWC2_33_15]OFX65811.1 MAG: hypothetical protein A2X15_13545 [Bacteroidetes bacterium GWB2_32_14]OFX69471.1 MAG: hypothetical protein A2X14_09815 [Bacteroidetes bacterium GWD2_33_33]HAN17727.1 hypothetical protein [Bacteroidales bacterium]
MNCKNVKNKIPDYIEGKLPEDIYREITGHIQNCTECTALVENLNKTLSSFSKNERIPEQPYYFTRLKQRMENNTKNQESFVHVLLTKKIVQPAIYLASLVIAVYIGILIGSGTTNSTQYSESTQKADTSYIKTYAQYQFVNDLEIESVEKNMVSGNTEPETNNK